MHYPSARLQRDWRWCLKDSRRLQVSMIYVLYLLYLKEISLDAFSLGGWICVIGH